MMTLQLAADALSAPATRESLELAAVILRRGGLVALPTETVYGLGANALDSAAVERIFAAKRRPAWDPVIVHIAPGGSKLSMLDALVEDAPPAARRLMEAFWPGPLTLLLPRTRAVPDSVTAGRPLVGVRMPAHPVALELIRCAQLPLAAPSANLFGHISPTTAAHVLHDLDGRIDAVLDAGPTGYGLESTVLDPGPSPMVIYRPGAVTAEQIRALAGPVEFYRDSAPPAESPRAPLPSPGVGLRHYAPQARLLVVDVPQPESAAVPSELASRLAQAASALGAERIGIMLPRGVPAPAGLGRVCIYDWGRWDALDELARGLYAGLRELDASGCSVILCPLPPARGIGAAIRDRLRKAGAEGEGR